jgi:ATP-dependent DNA helicase RecQ
MDNYLRKKIEENQGSDKLVVIKGFSLKGIIEREVSINDLLKDKLAYFINIQKHDNKIVTFDEYVVLYDFILSQYNEIVILDNNMYYNFYPLSVNIDGDIIQGLINHYDSELAEHSKANDQIKPYMDIYSNIVENGSKVYVTYNKMIRDEKESIINLFETDSKQFSIGIYDESIKTFDVIDELDYLPLVEILLASDDIEIQIVRSNLGINSLELMEKMSIICTINPNIKIRFVKKIKEVTDKFVHPDLQSILKKYWGVDEFREILVYDIDAVDDNRRELEKIKQSDVITHLVEQVERCRDRDSFRDIFVTAPTGAGKSAMFQIPAIYLAQKYELFTIVISPLIGLMQDQVAGLDMRGYPYSRTINSDISPIKKQEIIDEIANGECHILYISPESLMSKSDLIQLIGPRKLGMLVIDEAHIVTTWGKQFRPDYWYLGDHIMKLRKSQLKREGMQFVIATFTATAIYGGLENMYQETIQSLHMIDPITYLGYVRRNDILFKIDKTKLIKNRSEYELDKFEQLLEQIKRSIIQDKKMLIYFPTVALIERFYDHCRYAGYEANVTKYHGRLDGFKKEENYLGFKNKEKLVMIATKAFGMGIDIDDIERVMHFAPTGNVCDYLQEVGRAARRPKMEGEALYKYMSSDFKHINRLHGLSTIREYQLIEVIKKVYQLHNENIRKNSNKRLTKKRNEMLVDAESFAHIFENPFFNEDDGINKVKTAMLLIQKDFERTMSYSPFYVRPIPLFEIGFFKLDSKFVKELNYKYNNAITVIKPDKEIYNVNLRKIWENKFDAKYSFPKFKYMLYTKDEMLDFDYMDYFDPALKVDVSLVKDHRTQFDQINDALKHAINNNIRAGNFIEFDKLVAELSVKTGISKYRSKNVVEVTLSAMRLYSKEYSKLFHSNLYKSKILKSGAVKYSFTNVTSSYFKWLTKGIDFIEKNIEDGEIYLNQNGNVKLFKEYLLILGILESYETLSFKALGGRNSQLYIYVNQTKTMKEIINKPQFYKNRLLALVGQRHELSVLMLTYLFENDLSSEEIWTYVEDYFIGRIPEEVISAFEEKTGTALQFIN